MSETTTSDLIKSLRNIAPSCKTDVTIRYGNGVGLPYESFSVQVNDIWGHVHSPSFIGKDLHFVLRYAIAFATKFVAGGWEDGSMPWLGADGETRGGTDGWDVGDLGEMSIDEKTPARIKQEVGNV